MPGSGFAEVLVGDNELAALALQESTATLKLAGVTVKTKESALYDSQGNGLAVRTNLACLVLHFGQTMPERSTWSRQPTSCGRGANSREPPHFVEKMLFMIPGVTKGVARVEPRWEDGVFLGVSDRSDELFMGTDKGMHKVRTHSSDGR